jgi:hypothetical protein
MPHYLFTEQSAPKPFIRNIQWLRGSLPKEGELELVPGLFGIHTEALLTDLRLRAPKQTIHEYCQEFDLNRELPNGTALRIVKVLIWRRVLVVDLSKDSVERQHMPHPTEPTTAVDQQAQTRRAA